MFQKFFSKYAVIATCDQEISNNITYIVSPSFPGVLSRDVKSCKLKIKMIDEDISQLRFDFIHFQLGQPNRWTGICEGDLFSVTGGVASQGDFKICGQNSGQHIYYDVESSLARPPTGRQSSESTPISRTVEILMNFTESAFLPRLWEIRVAQIPFSQRAPAGCLQYFTGSEGLIQTFNYAENGRHLANQNYRACIRQEIGMCSIAYEPCNPFSFRIGQQQQMYYPGYPYGGFPGVVGGGPGGIPGGVGGVPSTYASPGGVPAGTVNSGPPGSGGPLSDSVVTDAATNGADATNDAGSEAGGEGGGDGLPDDGAAAPPEAVSDDASDGVANDEVDENVADDATDDAEGSGGGGFFSSLSSLFSFR
uniref:Uncharacterized protein n=1 Tax=Phlebotomus papatasi TaxID=29031 RepID=A0A1B0CZX3_PHLPP